MNRVTINGVTITANGNISINNGRIVVDNQDVTPDAKQITISVEGNVDTLTVDACQKITMIGDAGNIKTQSGDVEVTGNVNGSVSTMSGDIDCGAIGGNASTMSGDIKTRKA